MLWYVHIKHVISLIEMVRLCCHVYVPEAMVGTLTLIAGVAETIIWSQPTIWSEFARRNLENLAIFSPYAIRQVTILLQCNSDCMTHTV